ncbi:MAG: aldose 1-epimerase family protein [Varibaculum sp.]|nr:aldose 1-epimerase family protein [Varibaculum sp.]
MTGAHEYVELHADDYRADIACFGAGPRKLTWQGRDLLASYPRDTHRPAACGMILAPWPNRITDGVYIHDGTVQNLTITETGRNNAIHGFVGEQDWQVTQQTENRVTLSLQMDAQPGYPWAMKYVITWELDANSGLSGTFKASNRSATRAPFGVGFHPYLLAQNTDIDECQLIAPVTAYLPLEPERNLPAGPPEPVENLMPELPYGANLAGKQMDHCFGGVKADTGGAVRAQLIQSKTATNPGRGVALWADSEWCRWLQIYTADPARHEGFPRLGRAIAVEPMSCPPDAFRSGRDLKYLAAGETFTARLGFNAI